MSKIKKALEKAKEARQTDGFPFAQENKGELKALRSETEKRELLEGAEVKINYSQTKICQLDPCVLKQNKVFSLFEESKTTDQMKILRTQLLNKLEEIGGNSFLVTSAYPGEGKTFISINLGVSIAQELDRTVLLVDADLRNPSFNHCSFSKDFWGVDFDTGLSDYLTGKSDIPDLLLNPGIKKLTILPGGKALSNSAELLGSSKMESLVKEMKDRYRGDRIIIFDSPAILTCSDALVLSRYVDCVLLVVEEEKTSGDDLKRVMELLKDTPIAGTVLNKSKEKNV